MTLHSLEVLEERKKSIIAPNPLRVILCNTITPGVDIVSKEFSYNWDYIQSVFFSLTILTTIGREPTLTILTTISREPFITVLNITGREPTFIILTTTNRESTLNILITNGRDQPLIS
jgi:hypothetical protein